MWYEDPVVLFTYFFYHYKPCVPYTLLPKGTSVTVTPPYSFVSCKSNSESATATATPLAGQDITIEFLGCNGSLDFTKDLNGAGLAETFSVTHSCDNTPIDLERIINKTGSGSVTITIN